MTNVISRGIYYINSVLLCKINKEFIQRSEDVEAAAAEGDLRENEAYLSNLRKLSETNTKRERILELQNNIKVEEEFYNDIKTDKIKKNTWYRILILTNDTDISTKTIENLNIFCTVYPANMNEEFNNIFGETLNNYKYIIEMNTCFGTASDEYTDYGYSSYNSPLFKNLENHSKNTLLDIEFADQNNNSDVYYVTEITEEFFNKLKDMFINEDIRYIPINAGE